MCDCASCKYTDSFSKKGFAAWPKGEPKGPAKARAEYTAHVAHSYSGGIRRTVINQDPIAFYGIPKGLTRAEVRKVLNRSFAANEEGPSESLAQATA